MIIIVGVHKEHEMHDLWTRFIFFLRRSPVFIDFWLFSFSFLFFREEHDLSSMQQKQQHQTIRKLYQPFLTPLAFVQYFNVYNHISLIIIAWPPSAIGQPVL